MTATAEVALVPVETRALAPAELTIEQIVEQTKKIQQCIALVMIDGEHYGVIPGTQPKDGKPPKKVLLKPGAEKLCLLFRLDPEYDIVTSVETPSLIRFVVKCTLTHIPSGLRTASGLGSCNSNEDKYLRPAAKKCPTCGKETVIKGSEQYGGGWLCWKKKGGCGGKWNDGAPEIEGQDTGIKDPADLHNTILKMACKRALVAAVLNATAASDFFTQDLDDLTEKAAEHAPKDDLKEKLSASLKTTVPAPTANAEAAADTSRSPDGTDAAPASASSSGSEKKFGKRFPKAAGAGATETGAPSSSAAAPGATSTAHAVTPANQSSTPKGPTGPATADTGEAATADQKEALRLHIRKKGWKRGFVRIWFVELFGDGLKTEDPLEALSLQQADAAFTLLLAHGTDNYRKIRADLVQQGLVKRDENDLQF